jgi:hypothetical protein
VQVERGSNAAHSHSDAGHLELHVAGEDVLVDTGRYLYGNCGRLDWWEYFQSTRAHNTVEVDRKRMAMVPDTPFEVRCLRTFCHRFEPGPDVDVIEVSHNGYAYLDEPIFHLRRVFFFKPCLWLVDDILTGMGNHEYRLCFNFAEGSLEADTAASHSFRFVGRKNRIRCQALVTDGISAEVLQGSHEPKGGWISYAYSEKTPIPQLIYGQRGPAPARFVTALYAEDNGSAAVCGGDGVNEVRLAITSDANTWEARLELERFRIKRS